MDKCVASTYSSTAQLTKLLPPANEVCEGYVFTHVCLSMGGIPACLAGGIPACLAGLQGGCVSQHALQVSRPTPKGELEGSGQGGFSRTTPGGVLQAHPTRGGLQANSRGGVSQQADPPSWWLLLRAVRILLECILVISLCSSSSRNWRLGRVVLFLDFFVTLSWVFYWCLYSFLRYCWISEAPIRWHQKNLTSVIFPSYQITAMRMDPN